MRSLCLPRLKGVEIKKQLWCELLRWTLSTEEGGSSLPHILLIKDSLQEGDVNPSGGGGRPAILPFTSIPRGLFIDYSLMSVNNN